MTADVLSPLRWDGGALYLIDQLRLPGDEVWNRYDDEAGVAEAIRTMVVRGAPAIGCAAAYGIALAARRLVPLSTENPKIGTTSPLLEALEPVYRLLAETRPTAVNLFWAIEQMRACAEQHGASDAEAIADALEARAIAIHAEDIAMCQAIGRFGAELIADQSTVLTHCNAGALATGGYGTALGVVRSAREAGKSIKVLADETRPFLQGSRLTAWELCKDGFDVTIIPDSAAAFLMSRGDIGSVVVGADRIAANGDVANKIGTYAVALAAHRHDVPFYVAAPVSTLDLATASGADIPIEERSAGEMTRLGDTTLAPAAATARYPAFDITPAELVTAIITDRGIARPPYVATLSEICNKTR